MNRLLPLAGLGVLLLAGCPETAPIPDAEPPAPAPPEPAPPEPAPPEPLPPEPTPPEPIPEMTLRWQVGVLPVDVLASSNLSGCQFNAIEVGAEQWENEVGAELFHIAPVSADHDAFDGAAPEGTIAAESASLKPPTVGLATIWHSPDRIIRSVRVQLDEENGCDLVDRVAAHELGHALGLEHAAHPDCLLYMSVVEGPWRIHDYEIEWIRAQLGHPE